MPIATARRTVKPSLRTTDTPVAGDMFALIGHNVEIDPLRIVVDEEFRARRDLPADDDVNALRLSMRSDMGQLQPIVVTPDSRYPGKLRLVDGEHRLTAKLWDREGRKANPSVNANPGTTIQCIVVGPDEVPSNDKSSKEAARLAYRQALHANRDRKETTPIDDMHAYTVMQRLGFPTKDAAKALGKSEPWLVTLRDLAKADPRIQQLVAERKMSAKAGAACAGLNGELVERILSDVDRALKQVDRAATVAEKAIESEAEKAKIKAAREREAQKAAAAAVKGARAEQPKEKGKRGRKAGTTSGGAADFRNGQSIANLFTEIFTGKDFSAQIKAFAEEMQEYCHNRSSMSKVVAALRAVETGKAPARTVPQTQAA